MRYTVCLKVVGMLQLGIQAKASEPLCTRHTQTDHKCGRLVLMGSPGTNRDIVSMHSKHVRPFATFCAKTALVSFGNRVSSSCSDRMAVV